MQHVESARVGFTKATVDITSAPMLPNEIPDGMPGATYLPRSTELWQPGTVSFVESAKPQIEFYPDSWRATVCAPSEKLGDGTELLYLAQGMAEGMRQKRGTFMMHAAATVDPSGNGHLLVGSPGSGKTVTTLALCLQQGHRLVGNDLVVLGRTSAQNQAMEFYDGTKYIDLRETACQANTFLRHIAPQAGRKPQTSLPSFMQKIRLGCDEAGIQPANGTIPIKHVWHVWLDGRNQQAAGILDQPRLVRSLFFSERMGRHISGTVSPFKARDGSILAMSPNFDSPQAREARMQAANFLAGICRLVTGPDGARAAALIADQNQ